MNGLVKCKFIDSDGNPRGQAYTYGTLEALAEGEIVLSGGKKLIVVASDIPLKEGEIYGDKLKYVTAAGADKTSEEETKTVESVGADTAVLDESLFGDELIVVEQLPVITERLKNLSEIIDKGISAALALPVSEGSIATVKKARAALNNSKNRFEERRMAVKKSIMAPYEAFEKVYREYVTSKFEQADSLLKERIGNIENAERARVRKEVEAYFQECCSSRNINFLLFEDAKINVTLSASLKNLKEQAKAFVDRVAEDVASIDTMENKEEILVEYMQGLNISKAVATVNIRRKAIEEQRQRLAETSAQTAAEQAAVQKVESVTAPVKLGPPEINQKPVVIPKVTFSVFNETKERLILIKQFLTDGGYKYE